MSLSAPLPPGARRVADAPLNPFPDDPAFLTTESRVIRGIKRPVTPPNPAAGAEWSIIVPGGRQWRVLAARAQLVSDAVVANRQPGVVINVAGVIVCRYVGSNTMTASNTFDWSWFVSPANQGQGGPGAGGALAIPYMWLPPQSTFGSRTIGLDVGDQWQNVGVYIEEALFDDTDLTDVLQNALAGR